FDNEKITFLGGNQSQAGQISSPAQGLAMSDITYAGGTVSVSISYNDAIRAPSAQIVIVRNPINNSLVTAGIEGDILNPTLNARFVVNIYDATEQSRTGTPGSRPLSATSWV